MKYYKNQSNNVFAYEEDGSQDHIIPKEYVAISEEEAYLLANPEPTPEEIQKNKNIEMRRYLDSTDWYVIRHAETGVEIPQDILDARSAARLAIVE